MTCNAGVEPLLANGTLTRQRSHTQAISKFIGCPFDVCRRAFLLLKAPPDQRVTQAHFRADVATILGVHHKLLTLHSCQVRATRLFRQLQDAKARDPATRAMKAGSKAA